MSNCVRPNYLSIRYVTNNILASRCLTHLEAKLLKPSKYVIRMDLHGSYRLTFVGEGIATALRTMAHLENQTNNF